MFVTDNSCESDVVVDWSTLWVLLADEDAVTDVDRTFECDCVFVALPDVEAETITDTECVVDRVSVT